MWGSEYGVETNFWLKFRPYLHCKHTPRLGPELGGMKFWCNPDYFEVHSQQTRYLLTTSPLFRFQNHEKSLVVLTRALCLLSDCSVQPHTWYR